MGEHSVLPHWLEPGRPCTLIRRTVEQAYAKPGCIDRGAADRIAGLSPVQASSEARKSPELEYTLPSSDMQPLNKPDEKLAKTRIPTPIPAGDSIPAIGTGPLITDASTGNQHTRRQDGNCDRAWRTALI
jgi:hypothetical protein